MDRIVHFDLKGAPMTIPYMESVILAAKSWGATGILYEWEDTFPYVGDLVEIGSNGSSNGEGMYSLEGIRHILQFTKDHQMKSIQLIQTIGHLEFVLKHQEFKDLREEPRSPAVLCPSKEKSLQLVKMMLEQALDLQPDAHYIHIGADEVWHQAVCDNCQRRAAENEHKISSLYLQHIQKLAVFLKQKRPNLNILMWDDMLRSMSVAALKEYQLGELVQPVVWDYNALEHFNINPGLWMMYKEVFPHAWAGSAFKGANGSCKVLSPVERYVSNHEAWRREMAKLRNDIHFSGIILTGWSRFDHYATLCELMAVSLPSLASCLRLIQLHDNECITNEVVSDYLPSYQWPAIELSCAVQTLLELKEECDSFIRGDAVQTWLNPWQQERNYTNPTQIIGVAGTAEKLLSKLTALKRLLQLQLSDVTGERSKSEFIDTLVTPVMNEINKIYTTARSKCSVDASVKPI